MVGLVIGIVRMIMDFAYSAPLCMEEDLRPAIVSQVNLAIHVLISDVDNMKYDVI